MTTFVVTAAVLRSYSPVDHRSTAIPTLQSLIIYYFNIKAQNYRLVNFKGYLYGIRDLQSKTTIFLDTKKRLESTAVSHTKRIPMRKKLTNTHC